MDFDLTEEQRAIQDTARTFAREEMMPFARQWDEDEVFPADTLRGAAALAYGGGELRQRFLPDLCRMTKFGSYCLTEPESGSDAASLKTRAARRDDHYVLDGAKAFISGAGRSDVYLVMA